MTYVERFVDEPIDMLLRRFGTAIVSSGVVGEVRRRRFFLSPGAKRRNKAELAQRRRARAAARAERSRGAMA
jgi:ribosomal protein S21